METQESLGLAQGVGKTLDKPRKLEENFIKIWGKAQGCQKNLEENHENKPPKLYKNQKNLGTHFMVVVCPDQPYGEKLAGPAARKLQGKSGKHRKNSGAHFLVVVCHVEKTWDKLQENQENSRKFEGKLRTSRRKTFGGGLPCGEYLGQADEKLSENIGKTR